MTAPILLLLIPASSACALAGGMAALFARQRRVWQTEATRQADAWQLEREMHRQTLRAVTGGRLSLCDPDELRALLTGERLWTLPLLDVSDVSSFRQNLREIAARRGFSEVRLDDLCSCVSEAAGNAIRHSQGGVAQVWAAEDGFSILVTDCGRGISPETLLGLGGEGAVSETLGFRLMLAMSDTLALSTGAEGTQLLLKIRNNAGDMTEPDAEGQWVQAA